MDVQYKKPRLHNFKNYKRIKIQELENEINRQEYVEKISQKLVDLQEIYKVANIDEKWKLIKVTMLTEAELVCGTKRISYNNKKNTRATQWWTEEIREM